MNWYCMLLITLLAYSCYDDEELQKDIQELNSQYSSLESRIIALEEQVNQMNTNISSIQTIVNALQNNVYVSKVETLDDGYQIYFTDNTTATIRNGEDGQKGEDGKDGKDAPIIGVAQEDGVYYWTLTLDGKTDWLLNNGEKLRVTGKDGHTPVVTIGADGYWYIDGVNTEVKAAGEDGKTPQITINSAGYWVIDGVETTIRAEGQDGIDGNDGQDGEDGVDGSDGVTPLLKIDADGYWTVSYDDGATYDYLRDSNNLPICAVGKNGEDGHTPEITIQQYTDGLYYWVKDGVWIIDENGKKIQAVGIDGKDGIDAIAPQLKIEDGRWMLSTDEGKTWTDIGQATGNDGKDGEDGDSFFQSVTEDEECVTLTLINGTTIQVPKYKKVTITFNKTEDIVIMPGSSQTINYTISGGSGNALVKAIGQGGWHAEVKATTATSGQIIITAPDPMTDDEIIVLVYDGENTTIMSYLCCVQGVINIASNYYEIQAQGETKEVPLSTNINYSVYIPSDARSWVSVQTLTKALREETLSFTIAANSGAERNTTVELRDNAGKAVQTIVFKQNVYALNINVTSAGSLSSLLTAEDLQNVRELKLTGTLNSADLQVLAQSIAHLTKLDLSEANLSKIPSMAFQSISNIESIILPDNLNEIETMAFYKNTGLKSIQFPNGLTKIGANAFEGCTALEQVNIPANTEVIDANAFKDCSALTTAVIPDNSVLHTLGINAFQGCKALTTINIPETLENISNSAFRECSALTTVTFTNANTLKSIGEYTFYDCTSLNGIVLGDNLETIGQYAFYRCRSLESITIPAKIQIIETYIFRYCSSLKKVEIANKSQLTDIEDYAFADCPKLALFIIQCTTPPDMYYYDAFYNTPTSNCILQVPAGCKGIYEQGSGSYWGVFDNIVEL